MSPKNHYHMICGEVVFLDHETKQPTAIRCNGVLIDPEKEIPVRLLGKAQQILQLNFHQKMDGLQVEVVDVVILNLMYLGQMTQEQFQKLPEGTKLQERPQPVPDLDTIAAQSQKATKGD